MACRPALSTRMWGAGLFLPPDPHPLPGFSSQPPPALSSHTILVSSVDLLCGWVPFPFSQAAFFPPFLSLQVRHWWKANFKQGREAVPCPTGRFPGSTRCSWVRRCPTWNPSAAVSADGQSPLLPDFPLFLTVLFHPLFSKVCSRHTEREAVMEVGQAKTRVGEQSAIPVWR